MRNSKESPTRAQELGVLDIESADALIVDFPSSRLVINTFLLLVS